MITLKVIEQRWLRYPVCSLKSPLIFCFVFFDLDFPLFLRCTILNTLCHFRRKTLDEWKFSNIMFSFFFWFFNQKLVIFCIFLSYLGLRRPSPDIISFLVYSYFILYFHFISLNYLDLNQDLFEEHSDSFFLSLSICLSPPFVFYLLCVLYLPSPVFTFRF